MDVGDGVFADDLEVVGGVGDDVDRGSLTFGVVETGV